MMRCHNCCKRLIKAAGYSLKGLFYALKNEQAFQYEAVVLLLVCGVMLFTLLPVVWVLSLIGAWLLVMALELVNSAVEKAFDLIDAHFRPEIKAGKDMLSGAVFIAICFNIVLWCVIGYSVIEGGQ